MITTDNLSSGQWTPVDRVVIPVGCQAAVDWANPRALAANVAELLNGYLERVYAYPHGSNWTLPTHIVPAAPDTETFYGTFLGPNQSVLSGGGPGVLSSVRDMFFMPARTLWLAPDFDPGSGFTAIGRTGAQYGDPDPDHPTDILTANKLQAKGDGDGSGVGKPYVDGTDIPATADFNLGLWPNADEQAWVNIEMVAGGVARWGWLTCGSGGSPSSSAAGGAPPHPPTGSVWRFTWRKEPGGQYDMAFVAQAAAVAVMKPTGDQGVRTSVQVPASYWPAADTPFRYPSEPAAASSDSVHGFGYSYNHGSRYFRRLAVADLVRCRDVLRMMTRSCILLDDPFDGSVMSVTGYTESVTMGSAETAYQGDVPQDSGPESLMGHAISNQTYTTTSVSPTGGFDKIASASLSADGSVWGQNDGDGIEYASSETKFVTSFTAEWGGAVSRGIQLGLISRVRVYLGTTLGATAGGANPSETVVETYPGTGRSPKGAVETLFDVQNLPVPVNRCPFDPNGTVTDGNTVLDNIGSFGSVNRPPRSDRWLHGGSASVGLVYDSEENNTPAATFTATLSWPSASSVTGPLASAFPYVKRKLFHAASGEGDADYEYMNAAGSVSAGLYPSFAVVVVDWNFHHCTLAGNG